MKLGKWKIELIAVVLLVVAGLGIWWFVATQDERKASSEYDRLVRFAQRQSVEIAIIEQSSKLEDYRRQLAKIQQASQVQPMIPVIPDVLPPVIDPVDIK